MSEPSSTTEPTDDEKEVLRHLFGNRIYRDNHVWSLALALIVMVLFWVGLTLNGPVWIKLVLIFVVVLVLLRISFGQGR